MLPFKRLVPGDLHGEILSIIVIHKCPFFCSVFFISPCLQSIRFLFTGEKYFFRTFPQRTLPRHSQHKDLQFERSVGVIQTLVTTFGMSLKNDGIIFHVYRGFHEPGHPS